MRTEWKTTDDPRWWAWALLSTVLTVGLCLLQTALTHEPPWALLAFPVSAVLSLVGTARSRLRLTDDGVEVRRLRTRVYRWPEIASVQRAPEWESSSVVWLRLTGDVPTSAPEVLSLPGVRGRAARDQALDDLVTAIRRRSGIERTLG